MITEVLNPWDPSTPRKWAIPFLTCSADLLDFLSTRLFRLYAIVSPRGVARPIRIAILSINIMSIANT